MSKQNKIRLTPRQAAAFTMARQFLIEPAEQPLDAIHRLIAIQAQYSTTVPLALWTRTASLSFDWAKNALLDTKVLVKTWCLRGTVHVLASADLAMMVGCVGPQQLRVHRRFMRTRRDLDENTINALNESILGALAQRPLGRSELHQAVPELASVEGASGPATMQDFAHWSGLRMRTVRETLGACAPDLFPIQVAAWHGDYYLRAEDEPALTDREEPQAVRFLPKFDPLLMACKDKQRFIGEHHLSQVYRRGGQVEAVVLLAGRAIATWRTRLQGTRLHFLCRPFGRLDGHERSMLTRCAEQLADFLEVKELELDIRASEE